MMSHFQMVLLAYYNSSNATSVKANCAQLKSVLLMVQKKTGTEEAKGS